MAGNPYLQTMYYKGLGCFDIHLSAKVSQFAEP